MWGLLGRPPHPQSLPEGYLSGTESRINPSLPQLLLTDGVQESQIRWFLMGSCQLTCFAGSRGPWLSPKTGGRRLAATLSSWGFTSISSHGDAPTRPNGQLWPCPAQPASTSPGSPPSVTSGSPGGRGPLACAWGGRHYALTPLWGPLLNLLNQSTWREEFEGEGSPRRALATGSTPSMLGSVAAA